jgi:hypothetical protein
MSIKNFEKETEERWNKLRGLDFIELGDLVVSTDSDLTKYECYGIMIKLKEEELASSSQEDEKRVEQLTSLLEEMKKNRDKHKESIEVQTHFFHYQMSIFLGSERLINKKVAVDKMIEFCNKFPSGPGSNYLTVLKNTQVDYDTDLTINAMMYEELRQLSEDENLAFAKTANLELMVEILEKHPSLGEHKNREELILNYVKKSDPSKNL